MIQGFKKFIMQGNVIDLAVAVVIGAAFGAVVDGLVKGIIDPLIAGIANTDGLEGAVWTVPGTTIAFGWGLVLSALIHFLAVALVVYLAFVVPMNKFKERQAAKAGLPEDVPAPTETELLVEIRDLLAKQNRA